MTPAEFAKLNFDEAIAYFRQQVPMTRQEWDALDYEARRWAFFVSAIARADLLQDIHAAILKALQEGTGLAEFRAEFDAISARRGWQPSAEFTPWRLQAILGQNIRNAYGAGRETQMALIAKDRPWRMWLHRDSITPRPAHRALHRKVFGGDDPVLAEIMPPCGFGCNCGVVAISGRDMKRMGLQPFTLTERVTIREKRTGRTASVPAINGLPIVEPGFVRTSGQGRRDALVQSAISRQPEALNRGFQRELLSEDFQR